MGCARQRPPFTTLPIPTRQGSPYPYLSANRSPARYRCNRAMPDVRLSLEQIANITTSIRHSSLSAEIRKISTCTDSLSEDHVRRHLRKSPPPAMPGMPRHRLRPRTAAGPGRRYLLPLSSLLPVPRQRHHQRRTVPPLPVPPALIFPPHSVESSGSSRREFSPTLQRFLSTFRKLSVKSSGFPANRRDPLTT